MAPEVLNLAKDAQVMLIKNRDGTLVNGSMGRVQGFVDFPAYKDKITNEMQLADDQESKNTSTDGDSKVTPLKDAVQEWPIVEFSVPGGKQEIIVMPETWEVRLPNGEVQASRTQVRVRVLPTNSI